MPLERPDSFQINLRQKLISAKYYNPEDIDAINREDLLKEEVYQDIFSSVLDTYYNTDITAAADFSVKLDKLIRSDGWLESQNKQLYLKYRAIVVYLQGCSLPIWPAEIVAKLIAKHFVFWVKWYIDIKEKTTDILNFRIWNEKEFSQYRKVVIKALRSNEEKVGDLKIKLSSDTEQPPHIKNWLIIYDVFFEKPEEPRTIADQVKFFSQSPDYKKLNEKERVIIQDVIHCYDMVRFLVGYSGITKTKSGKIPKKLDDGSWQKESIVEKEPIVIKQMAPEPAQPFDQSKIQAAYQGNPVEEKAIAQAQAQLAGKNAVQTLFEAINNQDKNKTIAILRLLAQEKSLARVVAASSQLNSMFQGYLQAKFGKDTLVHFQNNSIQTIYTQLFLRYLLRNKLDLAEAESARQALHIANIYSQAGDDQYLEMAYADEQSGDFAWTEVVKGRNGLEVKK
ncbi:hypothetical protein KKI23_04025 [Patescibacteria group bacterium]|nr:hypothetical protein [Patescibacteria group bacterium]